MDLEHKQLYNSFNYFSTKTIIKKLNPVQELMLIKRIIFENNLEDGVYNYNNDIYNCIFYKYEKELSQNIILDLKLDSIFIDKLNNITDFNMIKKYKNKYPENTNFYYIPYWISLEFIKEEYSQEKNITSMITIHKSIVAYLDKETYTMNIWYKINNENRYLSIKSKKMIKKQEENNLNKYIFDSLSDNEIKKSKIIKPNYSNINKIIQKYTINDLFINFNFMHIIENIDLDGLFRNYDLNKYEENSKYYKTEKTNYKKIRHLVNNEKNYKLFVNNKIRKSNELELNFIFKNNEITINKLFIENQKKLPSFKVKYDNQEIYVINNYYLFDIMKVINKKSNDPKIVFDIYESKIIIYNSNFNHFYIHFYFIINNINYHINFLSKEENIINTERNKKLLNELDENKKLVNEENKLTINK